MQGTGRCAPSRGVLCQDRKRGGAVRHCRCVQQVVRQTHLPPPPCLWRSTGTVGWRGEPTLGTGKAEGEGRQQDRALWCARIAALAHQGIPHPGQGTQRGFRLEQARRGLGQGSRRGGRTPYRTGEG